MAEVWMAELAKKVREKLQVPKPSTTNWAHHQVVVEEEEPSLLINSSANNVAVRATKQTHEATLSDATLCMLIDRFTPC